MADNVDSFQRFPDRQQKHPAFPYSLYPLPRRPIPSDTRETSGIGLDSLCAGLTSTYPQLTTNFQQLHRERKPTTFAPAARLPSRRYQAVCMTHRGRVLGQGTVHFIISAPLGYSIRWSDLSTRLHEAGAAKAVSSSPSARLSLTTSLALRSTVRCLIACRYRSVAF